MHARRGWGLAAGLLAAGLLLAGCGADDGAERLADATKALDQAAAEVETAQATVDERRAAAQEQRATLAQLEAQLAESEQALREAKLKLREAQTAVDRNATDTVLFRSIQQAMLDDRKLGPYGIRVFVERGVVVLSGTVDAPALRDRAVEIAGKQTGVSRVESRIEVHTGRSEAAAPSAADAADESDD